VFGVEKTRLTIGCDEFIVHDGKVVKLGAVGSLSSAVKLDGVEHVVVPVPPSESAKEGTKFEDSAWNLIALLLHHARVGQSDYSKMLDEVSMLQKETARLNSEIMRLREADMKLHDAWRQSQMDLEAFQTDLNRTKQVLGARCDDSSARLVKMEARCESLEEVNRSLEAANLSLRKDNDDLRQFVLDSQRRLEEAKKSEEE